MAISPEQMELIEQIWKREKYWKHILSLGIGELDEFRWTRSIQLYDELVKTKYAEKLKEPEIMARMLGQRNEE